MRVVQLDEKWQGGPASLELEVDEFAEGPALILRVETASEVGAGYGSLEIPLGAGEARVRLPEKIRSQLSFSVAATLEQARELHAAIGEALADMEAAS